MILRKIPDIHVMPDLQVSLIGNLIHDHFHQSCFTFSIPSDKSNFLSSQHIKIHFMQYHMITIRFTQIPPTHDNIPRTYCRLKSHIDSCRIFLFNLDSFYFFQLFDPGLYLYRFRRLITETLDKILRILNLLLLVLVGYGKPCSSFCCRASMILEI